MRPHNSRRCLGTGKSSLPRLYMESIAGADDPENQRYLRVDVSPSWLDSRDLLGHVNVLQGRFQPSESGLFRHLIYAVEETQLHVDRCGVYLANLDEMNLAQVEHYFGGFLTALEDRTDRVLRCFDTASISEDCPFRAWASFRLPLGLRFVGTVNLDETAKQLSLRVLDRANFIQLVHQAGAIESNAARRVAEGRRITYGTFTSWQKNSQVDAKLWAFLEQLRKPLEDLGRPLNPRREAAIRTFLCNVNPAFCTPLHALDLQIARRISNNPRPLS